ncbi:MAG: hypothetical protein KKA65_03880, partial [Nanoarchaeota archaeon]|nr:hypothetical protein [Nanoarchaeota archaeon]
MKKIALIGLVALGMLGSGNLEAKEPKAEYKWESYTVKSKDIFFKLEEIRVRNKTSQNCNLYLGSIELTDRGCDNSIEWIKDKTGIYNREDGPKERFDKADKLMGKYRAKFQDFHKEWEKIRWTLDPLNK